MDKKLFLAQQMIATLMATDEKIQKQANRISEELTVRQFMSLLAVTHLCNNDASYNNIAHKLGTTKQNAKQIINVLEKKKYVIVLCSDSDRRSVDIRITPEGQRVLEGWGRNGNDFLLKTVENFSEQELETLWALLKKLYTFDGTDYNGYERRI